MNLGAGFVCFNRKSIFGRMDWAFLVLSAKCFMLGDIYSVCKENPERNARGNDTFGLHEREIQF